MIDLQFSKRGIYRDRGMGKEGRQMKKNIFTPSEEFQMAMQMKCIESCYLFLRGEITMSQYRQMRRKISLDVQRYHRKLCGKNRRKPVRESSPYSGNRVMTSSSQP